VNRLAIAAAFVAMTTVVGAQAQTYPSKPITVVVPFPAGGSTGALARILIEPLQVTLGQSIIIENVGGASTALR
jgi:tripartite-type tricarboxylate transporter receptor subunit TctC